MSSQKTYREKVMNWWNSIEALKKQEFVNVVFEMPKRSYKSLTGREIEKIYEWEHCLNNKINYE